MSTEVSEEQREAPCYRFDEFVLDVPDRQLWRAGTRIDLNARYLDALVLLVRERGQLVEKDRFFDEVWSDVVVSDSALTQCIKEIRKQLDDDASNPRYIQTVPRHGYRFIGAAEPAGRERPRSDGPLREDNSGAFQTGGAIASRGEVGPRREVGPMWRDGLHEWGAGTLGGAVAGLLGGLLYGFGLASAEAGVGTLSTLLVLVSLNVLVGLTGGFGVSFGLAGAGLAARLVPTMRVLLRVAGASLGGLFVGALAKLLGVDAFNLLFGRATEIVLSGMEGFLFGSCVVGALVLLGPRAIAPSPARRH